MPATSCGEKIGSLALQRVLFVRSSQLCSLRAYSRRRVAAARRGRSETLCYRNENLASEQVHNSSPRNPFWLPPPVGPLRASQVERCQVALQMEPVGKRRPARQLRRNAARRRADMRLEYFITNAPICCVGGLIFSFAAAPLVAARRLAATTWRPPSDKINAHTSCARAPKGALCASRTWAPATCLQSRRCFRRLE